ncbi:MAG: amino acid permease [Alphaproteobacteria bacterium]|jgi:tyrosine-specific transport protein|nr:amino acid permease [Candidatus Jidaibacter sp.]
MNKQTGSILLVAGTCIGSGMIALPMVLAKLGLIPSILLMLLTWLLMYYTSLINLELNLQAGKGMSLGSLGMHFSGPIAGFVGNISLKLLSYSLLAVFIYGGSSIIQKITSNDMDLLIIESICALFSVLVLLLPMKTIDYINRILFISLLTIVAVLLFGLLATINWYNVPLYSNQYTELSVWRSILPVVFTSFGFQVIFHTLTDYCNKEPKMLKKAFLWGSAIPAIVYITWTCSILGAIYNYNPEFYSQMVDGKAEVGDLVYHISKITEWQSIQLLIWCVSLLAIVTSIIGVGRGLYDTLSFYLRRKIPNSSALSVCAAIFTILPAYLVAALIPNAFILVLGFAGMILAVIAIILPIYLFLRIKGVKLYYNELYNNYWIYISLLAGVGIILAEAVNILL